MPVRPRAGGPPRMFRPPAMHQRAPRPTGPQIASPAKTPQTTIAKAASDT